MLLVTYYLDIIFHPSLTLQKENSRLNPVNFGARPTFHCSHHRSPEAHLYVVRMTQIHLSEHKLQASCTFEVLWSAYPSRRKPVSIVQAMLNKLNKQQRGRGKASILKLKWYLFFLSLLSYSVPTDLLTVRGLYAFV